jgi:hypothetical protein
MGQDLAASSMILIHKFFKTRSLKGKAVSSGLHVLAVACVFLTAKDKGIPFRLFDASRLLYMLEIRNLEKAKSKEGFASTVAVGNGSVYLNSGSHPYMMGIK